MIGIHGVNPVGKLILDIIRSKGMTEKIVFIDDNPSLHKTIQWGVPVEFNIGSWRSQLENVSSKCKMIVALGEKHLLKRKTIFDEFSKLANLDFLTLIDGHSVVAPDAAIEKGNIICRGSMIGHEVVLKSNSIFWAGSVVEHNSQIGESCYVSPHATISGFVKIGNSTLIGSGAIILPGIQIGHNCLIGAGSVVTKDLKDNSVVLGNPAKIIRSNPIHL